MIIKVKTQNIAAWREPQNPFIPRSGGFLDDVHGGHLVVLSSRGGCRVLVSCVVQY